MFTAFLHNTIDSPPLATVQVPGTKTPPEVIIHNVGAGPQVWRHMGNLRYERCTFVDLTKEAPRYTSTEDSGWESIAPPW